MTDIKDLSKKLREARAKATSGEWQSEPGNEITVPYTTEMRRMICEFDLSYRDPKGPFDCEFVVLAANNITLILDELDRLIEESEGYKKHVVGGPENLGRMIQVYEDNRKTMNESYDRLIEVEKVLKRVNEKLWFDPSSQEGACMLCDANLHENAMGKHQQLNGEPCPVQMIHDALKRADEIGKGK